MTRIPYDRKTDLVDLRVEESFRRTRMAIAEFERDGGGFLGDKKLPPDARLERHWQSITNPDGMINFHDMALIMDPGTEVKIRNGLSDAPQTPTWLNYLRIPGLFTEQAKDFVALNAADVKKREGGNEVAPDTSQGTPPFGSSPSLSVSQTPALSASQPSTGGYPGGYGTP